MSKFSLLKFNLSICTIINLCYNNGTTKRGIVLKNSSKRLVKLGLIVMTTAGILSTISVTPLETSALFEANKVNAYELIVDGKTWFILEDIQQITKILDQFKTKMTPALTDGIKLLEVNFEQDVEIVPVKVDKKELSIIDNLTRKLNYPVQDQENYIVKEGDSAWKIANTLNISLEEIAKMNPDIDLEKLWPNDQLVISSVKHYLNVKVTLQSTVEEVIHYKTNTTKDASLSQSSKKTIKAGVDGVKEVTYIFEYVNAIEKSNSILNETVLLEPVTAEVVVGSKPITLRSSSGKSFGVTTGNLSSDYGWRTHPISGKRSFHDGIDIANQVGTAINAYADGTITKASWTDSYGNYIVIDHGGGLETYYIHLSGFDVSVGDSVTAGQLIGRMGKTGSATGSHLQFEVRLNGVPQNPWEYL